MNNEVHPLEHLEGVLCPVCSAAHKLFSPNNRGWHRPTFHTWECDCGACGQINYIGSKILCLQTNEEVENLKKNKKRRKAVGEVKNRKEIDEKLKEIKRGIFRVTIKKKE